jgi:hypothetical protein
MSGKLGPVGIPENQGGVSGGTRPSLPSRTR